MEFRKITPNDFNLIIDVDFLFYRSGYLNVQKYENPVAFTVADGTKLLGLIVLDCVEPKATSLTKSPFGSLWVANEVPKKTLPSLVAFVQTELTKHAIHQLEITIPPPIYSQFLPLDFWTANGFQLQSNETNQHLEIRDDFRDMLHPMERRKLRKLETSEVLFAKEPSDDERLTECHAFIAKCRKEQGLEINIKLNKLLALNDALKERYHVFTARKVGELIAAVITCLVDNDHMYYYLPATAAQHKKESPMVGLLALIYENCRIRGIEYLDLGVSSIAGVRQKGLYDFKKRIGALESNKITVYREW